MRTNYELCIVLFSKETRDELNDMVPNSGEIFSTRIPKELGPSISIVGLSQECSELIVSILLKQNQFLRRFGNFDDLNEHLLVKAF